MYKIAIMTTSHGVQKIHAQKTLSQQQSCHDGYNQQPEVQCKYPQTNFVCLPFLTGEIDLFTIFEYKLTLNETINLEISTTLLFLLQKNKTKKRSNGQAFLV